ncbi:predicted protein [Sclerotinia sclerotiorum 1980 UF-70]|uniref:Uncharacterized protein n=1 Tax=Sclerotinia sclerotiorum (strain ATCC 18683 / 1980 / Ss-1) TaxID=665079 RepID=A7EZS4_SCLS1|nr:predicted protein [Sclerotinia sclerotiorum 1980 UF-70]EDN94966.1 predicted protein [Sclerotinia sclerotiorum 1980 UF-70]
MNHHNPTNIFHEGSTLRASTFLTGILWPLCHLAAGRLVGPNYWHFLFSIHGSDAHHYRELNISPSIAVLLLYAASASSFRLTVVRAKAPSRDLHCWKCLLSDLEKCLLKQRHRD